MPKIVLPPITGSYNMSQINENFSRIADALNDGALWRDNPSGTPNEMDNVLDMDGNRIYNLPTPYLDHEPARMKELREISGVPFSYFGPLDSVPTTRPDGSPLVQGDSYYNTVTNLLYYWNGTTWFIPNVDGQTLAQPSGSSLVGFIQEGQGAKGYSSQEKMRQTVSPSDFGAIGDGLYHPLSERFASLAIAQASFPFVTSLTQSIDYAAIQAAVNSLEGKGGVVEDDKGLTYVITQPGILIPDSVTIRGSGAGFWDTVFPGRAKTWQGTTFLLYGNGAKTWSRRGITSMKTAGGWRADASLPGQFFTLSSLMNTDASGAVPASPKGFSVGFRAKNRISKNWGIERCRIVPWIGVDGKSEYSNTAYNGLAADWDIGILLEDAEYVKISEVQAVGYWRQYGCLLANSDFDEFGGQERNLIETSKFQGLRGLSMRSGDTRAVAAKTASTVEILWDEESFWPSSGTFTGFPASSFTIYSYTSLSRNGNNLVFNGVTPNPLTENINTIRSPMRSSGAAGTVFRDVFISGLDHTSGATANALGLGNSTAFEMSGFPLRGVAFANTKVQSRERILAFYHDCQDTLLNYCQFEGSGQRIASPLAGESTAPAPSGDTRNMRVLSTLGLTGALFTPRSIFNDTVQFNATGLNSGFDIRSPNPNPITISTSTGTEVLRVVEAGSVGIGTTNPAQKLHVANSGAEIMRLQRTATGLVGLQYTNANGTLSIRSDISASNAGSFFGSGDNTISNGTASFRWSQVFAGNGTINTSDGRFKTDVAPLTEKELTAASRLAKEIGTFSWLQSIEEKGGDARKHIGMTVQKAISILEEEGIDPMEYGFICYDSWDDIYEEDNGKKFLVKSKGDIYAFRPDQLYAFIIRGQEERLSKLEKLIND